MAMTSLISSLLPFIFDVALSAAVVDLPRSGQQTCSDEDGASISCAGTGQDGEIQAGIAVPDPRFVDHGDGTVSDLLTGLMWLKDRNCASTIAHDPAGTGTGEVKWLQALAFVARINDGTFAACQAGYMDWRLPNINELRSPATMATLSPALADGHPFLFDGGSSNYWSSTSNSGNGAWLVNYYHGLFSSQSKAFWNHKVWPVRGGSGAVISLPKTGQTRCFDENGDAIACAGSAQDGETQLGVSWPNPRLIDNGDGTITDSLTGLMWLQDLNCAASAGYDPDLTGDGSTSWQNALDFIAAVNSGAHSICAAGRNDWRLPNPIEFGSLISPHDADPSTWLADNGFTNLVIDWAWTSTSVATVAGNTAQDEPQKAYMGFPNGGFALEPKVNTRPFWLVRTHLRSAPLFADGFEGNPP